MNVADVLRTHARKQPDHPAIRDRATTIAYRALDPLVRRTAAHLNDLGVAPGDVVGVCLKDTVDHLVLLYGVARLGAVILPMDWRWTADERRRIAAFFEANLVVREADDSFDSAVPTVPVDDSWRAAVAGSNPSRPFPSDTAMPVALSLSSGTTGTPKGPMITHAHLHARFDNQRESFEFGPTDRFLSATPLYFGAGRHFAMGFLSHGGTVILHRPPFEPERLVRAVDRHRVTVLLLVPAMLRRLLRLPSPGRPLLHRLRILFSTGAMLHPDERRAVIERLSPNFINYYGSTEGGGISILRPEHGGAAASSVGRPLPAIELQVVDAADRPVPAGEAGRIRYRGPGVADGFYRDPEAGSRAFVDGWFYPGDLGRVDESGFVYLLGRHDDVIIRGGVNVYPEEIEKALLAHAGVRDAAVVGWPSAIRGQEIAAFVIANDTVDEPELIAFCRGALAPYKVPRAVFFVDEFPRNDFGKVRKPELVARLAKLDA